MKTIKIILLLFISSTALAQSDEYQMKKNDGEVEIDFLTSYYDQDGDNSAVEGGVGTEALWDVSSMMIVNVDLDSIKSLNIMAGADIYSSASTDMIDGMLNSSASSIDVRSYANVSYQQKDLKNNQTFGARAGFSVEYDYTSVNAGISYAKEWNDGNSEIALNAQAFIDQWQLIYPSELRSTVTAETDKRQSYNFQATYSQVLNTRMQMSISGEAIYMNGLLSTPFHRVVFSDQTTDIERLPSTRLKIPIGVRLNYFPTDGLVIRSYYRYYYDDFGINAHTVSLETPIKVSEALTLYPFFRYHTQTASDYFAPKFDHASTEEFYTSDHDLSALSSQKYGLGIKYAPLYGVARAKVFNKVLMLKHINLRGAYYTRDTGLTGYLVSLNVGLTIK